MLLVGHNARQVLQQSCVCKASAAGHESALLEQVLRVLILRSLRDLRRAALRYRQHQPPSGEPPPHRRRLARPCRHLRCTCLQCWQLQQPRTIGDFLSQQRAGPQGAAVAVSAGVERQVHVAQRVALAAVPAAVGGCLLQQLGRTPVRRRPSGLSGLRRLLLHVVSEFEVVLSIEYDHCLCSIGRRCELILRLLSMYWVGYKLGVLVEVHLRRQCERRLEDDAPARRQPAVARYGCQIKVCIAELLHCRSGGRDAKCCPNGCSAADMPPLTWLWSAPSWSCDRGAAPPRQGSHCKRIQEAGATSGLEHRRLRS